MLNSTPALSSASNAPRLRGVSFLYERPRPRWYAVLMLTLYVKTGCPFCHKVLDTGEELGISFEEKNIADDAVAAELIARGGKRQVPYLVDSEKGIEMYESADIDAYLRNTYPKQ